jgi:Amt family ammonium transporter
VLIGAIAASLCYVAVYLKNKLHLDDALDVFGVHGIGGVVGCLCLGLFASLGANSAGVNGLVHSGNATFFLKQLSATAGVAVYAFLFSYAMLWLINKVTPVRVSHEVEGNGLDAGLHGEEAYI